MSDIRIDKITNRDGSAGTSIAGISTFSGTSGMIIPNGPTAYRGGRGRGVFTGGYSPGASPYLMSSVMNYIEIATTGNAAEFGDLAIGRTGAANASSSTRGLSMGGKGPATPQSNVTNTIDYVTISSQGGASDFGDLLESVGLSRGAGCSDSTRGIYYGGYIGNDPAFPIVAKGFGKQEKPSKGGKSHKPKPANIARCDMCKETGHFVRNFPNKKSFGKTKCSNCKGFGHPSSACPTLKVS